MDEQLAMAIKQQLNHLAELKIMRFVPIQLASDGR